MAPSPDWKTTNKSIQILHAAEEGKYGVLATVAYNIEHILGMIAAAETCRSPLIIQFFPWAITFSSGLLIRTAADAAARSSVPVAIHLDHAQDEAMMRLAAETLPFDSIMVDMSHYEKEENLAKTKELAEFCHKRGVATEAEPGRIEGGEDGVMDTEGLEGSMTTMEEVRDFVGTGWMRWRVRLEICMEKIHTRLLIRIWILLRQIRAEAQGKVRVALHGTNGFKPELMKKCIAEGVSKINVNRLVLDGYHEHLKTFAGKIPQTKLMEQGVEKVKRQTIEWMKMCGSAGKA